MSKRECLNPARIGSIIIIIFIKGYLEPHTSKYMAEDKYIEYSQDHTSATLIKA